MNTSDVCLVCGSGNLVSMLDLPRVPIQCSALIPTRQRALRVATGEIRLVWCEACSHIFNASFDSALVPYGGEYENSLDHSPCFVDYLESVAGDLTSRYRLKGGKVVEIGCGQASFLRLLLRLGVSKAVGYDPSYLAPEGGESAGLTVFSRLFTADCGNAHADLVCCRHTLEHIPHPVEFLSVIRQAYGSRDMPPSYFEVPNAAAMFEQNAVWDIIYPHVSYFTARSLAAAFRRAGLPPRLVYAAFGGQFLSLETGGGTRSVQEVPEEIAASALANTARDFARRYHAMAEFWHATLRELAGAGKRCVVWGSGAKAVSFLNTVGASGAIQYVVDVNPRRQANFIPGAGQEIVSPGFVAGYRPDVVIVMNPIYAAEIRGDLMARGVACEVLTADAAVYAAGASG